MRVYELVAGELCGDDRIIENLWPACLADGSGHGMLTRAYGLLCYDGRGEGEAIDIDDVAICNTYGIRSGLDGGEGFYRGTGCYEYGDGSYSGAGKGYGYRYKYGGGGADGAGHRVWSPL